MSKVPLFNPDNEDFTVTYDINEDGKPLSYTIHAGEIASFEPIIADHVRKHLVNRIVMKRGIKTNYEDDFKKVNKELDVTL